MKPGSRLSLLLIIVALSLLNRGADAELLAVDDVFTSHMAGGTTHAEKVGVEVKHQSTPYGSVGTFFSQGDSVPTDIDWFDGAIASYISNPVKYSVADLLITQKAVVSKNMRGSAYALTHSAALESVIEWTVPALAAGQSISWTSDLRVFRASGVTLTTAKVENLTQGTTLLSLNNPVSYTTTSALSASAGDLIRVSFHGSAQGSYPVWATTSGAQLIFTNDFTIVPEPTSLALVGVGISALCYTRRRRTNGPIRGHHGHHTHFEA